VARRRLGLAIRLVVAVVKPTLTVLTRRDWSGMEHVPERGPVIIAANHASEFDPLVLAHFVYDSGRWPQFLAKSSLFQIPLMGRALVAVRQIPVYRGTSDAAKALEAAMAALAAGDDVIIYPEGTTPKRRDGELWPERGKTGIARLVLATGAPVVPVVTWGAQQFFDPRIRKLRLRPRRPVTVLAGPPLDLSAWAGAPPTAANLHALTEEIMVALTGLLAQVRGEEPPPRPVERATSPSAPAVGEEA
jgi:1-acyl-sn-glycerol-3-phosphate acyltransferase